MIFSRGNRHFHFEFAVVEVTSSLNYDALSPIPQGDWNKSQRTKSQMMIWYLFGSSSSKSSELSTNSSPLRNHADHYLQQLSSSLLELSSHSMLRNKLFLISLILNMICALKLPDFIQNHTDFQIWDFLNHMRALL